MGVSPLTAFFGISSLIGQVLPAKPDYSKYVECRDTWDVKYPYLVEVRYSGEPYIGEERQKNYHKNRHGALLTRNTVLTRGHDLDWYPHVHEGEQVHTNLQECMRGGSKKPCLYVNTRRPRNNNDPNSEMCGFSSIVEQSIQAPQFLTTARQIYHDLSLIWRNTKFPFAVLVLKEKVPIVDGQTIFPSLILPRTPLDMLYMLRRVATMGHDSKLCEYPHYDKLTHDGHYGPYSSKVKVTTLDCTKDDWDNIERNRRECIVGSLCPKNSIHGGTWEGVSVTTDRDEYAGLSQFPIYWELNKYYRQKCEENMVYPYIFNHSFIVFLGEVAAFVTKKSPDLRRIAAEDKLGAPIVCNGVAIALTSTWHGRGTGRRDVYIGTSFFRSWTFINQMRSRFQDVHWNRAQDDHPFLGQYYSFKKKKFPKRNYQDRSMFELSLNEKISPRPKSLANRIHLDLATAVVFSVFIFSRR